MFFPRLSLLILVPIVEIFLFLEVYRRAANAWGTAAGVVVLFGSVVLSAAIGVEVLRRRKLAAIRAMNEAPTRGPTPERALDGLLILLGGLLLIAPGYLSDFLGLTMLLPWTRRLWRRHFHQWLEKKVREGTASLRIAGGRWMETPDAPPDPGLVIDVTPEDRPGSGLARVDPETRPGRPID